VYDDRYLYLSNRGEVYGTGAAQWGCHYLQSRDITDPEVNSTTFQTDYVLSGGDVCMGPAPTFTIQPCNGSEAYKIADKLGVNQAAYAGVVPVLNGWLACSPCQMGPGELQLALGCDSDWNGNCDNLKIDNGFEQLFLASTVLALHARTRQERDFDWGYKDQP